MVKLRKAHTKLKIILFSVLGSIVALGGTAAIVMMTGSLLSPAEPGLKANTKTEVPEGLTPAEAASDKDEYENTLYYLAYVLDTQDYYHVSATSNSVASAVSIKSLTRTTKDYANGVMIASDITSGITTSAFQTCYVADSNGETVVYRRNGSSASSTASVTEIGWDTTYEDTYYYYRADYLYIYGEFSTEMTVYLINEETIDSCSAITDNGDGTYTQTFSFNDEAAWWYQYAMYTNGDLGSLPQFDSIDMTVTFDADWRVLTVVVDEVTEVDKMGTWTTVAQTTTTFTYGESAIDSDNFAYYQSYYLSAMPYATAGGSTTSSASATAIDVLEGAFSKALSGGDQFAFTLNLGDTPYYGYIYLDIDIAASDILSELDVRIQLSKDEKCDAQDLYIELKNGNVNAYYSSDFALTANIDEISGVISQFSQWISNYSYGAQEEDNTNTTASAALTAATAGTSIDLADLLSGLKLIENEDGTVSVTLTLDNLFGISAYVKLDFNVVTETTEEGTTTTYTFTSGYIGDITYNEEEVDLSLTLTPTSAEKISHDSTQTEFDISEAAASIYKILNAASIKADLSADGASLYTLINSLTGGSYADYLAIIKDMDISLTAYVDVDGITTAASLVFTMGKTVVIDADIYYEYDGSSTYGIAYIDVTKFMGVATTVSVYCDIADLADSISDLIDLLQGETDTSLATLTAEELQTEEEEQSSGGISVAYIVNALLTMDFGKLITSMQASGTKLELAVDLDYALSLFVPGDFGLGEIALSYSYTLDDSGAANAGTLSVEDEDLGVELTLCGSSTAVTKPQDTTYLDLTKAVNSVYALLASTSVQLDLSIDGDKLADYINAATDSAYSQYINLIKEYDVTASAVVDINGITTNVSMTVSSSSTKVIALDVYYAYDGTSTYGIAYVYVSTFMNASTDVKVYCNIADLIDSVEDIIALVSGEEEQQGEAGEAGSTSTSTSTSVSSIISLVLGLDYSQIIDNVTVQKTQLDISLQLDYLLSQFVPDLTLNLGAVNLDYTYTLDEKGNAQAGKLTLDISGLSAALYASTTAVTAPADAAKYLDLTLCADSIYQLLNSNSLQLYLEINGAKLYSVLVSALGSDYADYLAPVKEAEAVLTANVNVYGITTAANLVITYGSTVLADADIYYEYIDESTGEYGTAYLAVNKLIGVNCGLKVYCDIADLADTITELIQVINGTYTAQTAAEEQGEEQGSSDTILTIINALLSVDYTKLIQAAASGQTLSVTLDADYLLSLFVSGNYGLGKLALTYSYTTSEGAAKAGLLSLTAANIGLTAQVSAGTASVTKPTATYYSLNELAENITTAISNVLTVADDIAANGASFELSGEVTVNSCTISVDGAGEVVLSTTEKTDEYGEIVYGTDGKAETVTTLKSVAVDLTLAVTNGLYGSTSNDVTMQVVYLADNYAAGATDAFLYVIINGTGIAVTYDEYKDFLSDINGVYSLVQSLLGTSSDGEEQQEEEGGSSVSLSDEDTLSIINFATGLLSNSNFISMVSDLADVLANFSLATTADGGLSLTYTYGEDGEGTALTFNVVNIKTANGKLTLETDIADISASISAYNSSSSSLASTIVSEKYDGTNNKLSDMVYLLYSYIFTCIDEVDIQSIFGSAAYALDFVLDGDASGISALEDVYVEVSATAAAIDNKNIYTLDASMDIGGYTVELSMAYYSGYIYVTITDIGGTEFTDLSLMASTDSIYYLAQSVAELIMDQDVLDLVSSIIPASSGNDDDDDDDNNTNTTAQSTVQSVIEMLTALLEGNVITINASDEQIVLINIDSILAPFGITAGVGTFTVDKITDGTNVTGVTASLTSNNSKWLKLTANGTTSGKYTAVESSTGTVESTLYTGSYVDVSFVSQLVEDICTFVKSGIQKSSESKVTGVEYTFCSDSVTFNVDLSSVSSILQSLTSISVTIEDLVVTVGYDENGICLSLEGDLQGDSVLWYDVSKDMHIGLTYYNGYITLQREASGTYIYKVMTLDYFMDNILADDSPLYWWLGMSQSLWKIVVSAAGSSSSSASEYYLYKTDSSTDEEEDSSISISDYITSLLVSLVSGATSSYGSDSTFNSWLTGTAGLSSDYYALNVNINSLTSGLLNYLYLALTHDDTYGLSDIWVYLDLYGYINSTINLTYSPSTSAATNQYLAADGDSAIAGYSAASGTGYTNSFGLYDSENNTYASTKTYDSVLVTVTDTTDGYSYTVTLDYGTIVYMNDYYVYDNETADDESDDYYIIFMYDYKGSTYTGASVTLDSSCLSQDENGNWCITFYTQKVSTTETVEVTEYYVTFDYNGGLSAAKSLNTTEEVSLYSTLDNCSTEETGDDYTFEGWYYDEECTQPVGAVYAEKDENDDRKVTVYAKYVDSEVDINGVLYTFAAAESLSYGSGTDSGYYYNTISVDGGYYVVSGYSDVSAYYSSSEWLVLESEILGYNVLEIGAAAFNGTSLKNVVVPESIVLIGANAFLDNYGMENIIFLADTIYLSSDYKESTYSNISSNDDQASKMFPFYGCSTVASGTTSSLNVYYNTAYSTGYNTTDGNDTNMFCFRVNSSGIIILKYTYYRLNGDDDGNNSDITHSGGTWLWLDDSSYISVNMPSALELESDDIRSTVTQAFMAYLEDNDVTYYNFTSDANGITGMFIGDVWTNIINYSGLTDAISSAVESAIDEYTAENETYIHAYVAAVEIDNGIRVAVTAAENAYYTVTARNYLYNDAGEYDEWDLTPSYSSDSTITGTYGSVVVTYSGDVEVYGGTLYAKAASTITVTANGSAYTLDGAACEGTAATGSEQNYTFTASDAAFTLTLYWSEVEIAYPVTIYSDVNFTLDGSPVASGTTKLALESDTAKLDDLTVTAPDKHYFLGWAYYDNQTLTFATDITTSDSITYYAIWGYSVDSTAALADTTTNEYSSYSSYALNNYVLSSSNGTFYRWYKSYTAKTITVSGTDYTAETFDTIVTALDNDTYTYYARMSYSMNFYISGSNTTFTVDNTLSYGTLSFSGSGSGSYTGVITGILQGYRVDVGADNYNSCGVGTYLCIYIYESYGSTSYLDCIKIRGYGKNKQRNFFDGDSHKNSYDESLYALLNYTTGSETEAYTWIQAVSVNTSYYPSSGYSFTCAF